jgi:hypothetical protein
MDRTSHGPVIDLALFDYSKKKHTLQISSEPFGIPRDFFVKSHKTGRVVHFVSDEEDMLAHEFYDGEAASYKPAAHEAPCSIIRAFIVNQY